MVEPGLNNPPKSNMPHRALVVRRISALYLQVLTPSEFKLDKKWVEGEKKIAVKHVRVCNTNPKILKWHFSVLSSTN